MTAEFLNGDEFLKSPQISPSHWNARVETEFLKFLNSSRRVYARGLGEGLSHTLIEELRNLRNLISHIIYQRLSHDRPGLMFLEEFEEFPRQAIGHPFCRTVLPIGFGRRLRPSPDAALAPTARTARRSP